MQRAPPRSPPERHSPPLLCGVGFHFLVRTGHPPYKRKDSWSTSCKPPSPDHPPLPSLRSEIDMLSTSACIIPSENSPGKSEAEQTAENSAFFGIRFPGGRVNLVCYCSNRHTPRYRKPFGRPSQPELQWQPETMQRAEKARFQSKERPKTLRYRHPSTSKTRTPPPAQRGVHVSSP